MVYEVRWTEEAKKDLRNLERELVFRIVRKIESIKENPVYHLKKLVGKDEWRLRIGNYRILIDLDNKAEMIYVLKIGHRKKVYD